MWSSGIASVGVLIRRKEAARAHRFAAGPLARNGEYPPKGEYPRDSGETSFPKRNNKFRFGAEEPGESFIYSRLRG